MQLKGALTALAILLLTAWPIQSAAASLNATSGPALTITPTTSSPGLTIHASVSGITTPFQQNITACLGILGPGNNVQENKSPSFRESIGMIAIDGQGSGQADVALPKDLVAGSYQVVIGSCPRQQGLAPLSAIASATMTISTGAPSPTVTPRANGTPGPGGSGKPVIQPTKLPATGGFPNVALLGLLVLGAATIGAGYVSKRRP
ncbi:MAG TPA: hypothetical protein VMW65_16350 [Chloroflexota bacterium]|nr:hypothetical protein [Chloroflexota bacterium]